MLQNLEQVSSDELKLMLVFHRRKAMTTYSRLGEQVLFELAVEHFDAAAQCRIELARRMKN